MMCNLREQFGTAMIIITHDLGIVAQICNNVAFMYAGELVEVGTLEDIFTGNKHHPYIEGLFGSIPNLKSKANRLSPITGLMPDPTDLPVGCKFHPRCPHCMDVCKTTNPVNCYQEGNYRISCHLFKKEGK